MTPSPVPADSLNLLCAGAAQGLVEALRPVWLEQAGSGIAGRFGAVGAMQEALLADEACDVFVATDKMVGELIAAGHLRASTRALLGRVYTAVAVRSGAHRPDVATPDALCAALLAADAIYFPDPVRSTAGIHFAGVLRSLGIADRLAAKLRPFPNGATAMRELAASGLAGAIGCTQVSEIEFTQGVECVARLPRAFELATPYTAAVASQAAPSAQAERFVGLLTGPGSHAMREAAGFVN